MMPTSVSQVLEASCKLVIGLAAAWCIKEMTSEISLAAGGAILGVTIGCGASAFYLFWLFRKAYKSLEEGDPTQSPDSYTKTARDLLAIAVPITIGSAGLQLITLLEVKVYMGQLLSNGFTQDAADTMKGIYDMSLTIFNMPCAFITPITVSAIPSITAALTLGEHKQVKSTEESASRIMALISMPCALGLFVLARPVMALLGGYVGAELDLSETLMRVLSLCIVFNSFVLLTNGIMQAHGHANIPVINMFVGSAVKLSVTWLLTGNPDIAIRGVPVASVACFLTIATLNLFSMNRCITEPPHMVRNMLRPLLSGLIMAAAVFGVYLGLGRVFTLGSTIGKLMLVGAPILVGVVVYVVCVVKLKAITREDCLLLPKGEKIAKLLHL
jgi:stage V sporulation protein B